MNLLIPGPHVTEMYDECVERLNMNHRLFRQSLQVCGTFPDFTNTLRMACTWGHHLIIMDFKSDVASMSDTVDWRFLPI